MRGDVINAEVYGFPVTLQSLVDSHGQQRMRIAVWMEGEQMRTKPLVEELFFYGDFHDKMMEVARTRPMLQYSDGQSGGPTEAFILDWFENNRRTIYDAEDRRRRNSTMSPLADEDFVPDTSVIPTRRYRGEDGRMYEELDLRGEDTDPILVDATINREKILADQERAFREETRRLEKIRKLEAERKEREQAQLEALEGWGAF